MKPLTYKALDNCYSLVAGHTYTVSTTRNANSRKLTAVDTETGARFTLYRHELEHSVLRGKLVQLDTTQSESMHADIVSKLCRTLETRYIY